jgi:metal-dependent amidase/aminoacylase/carboxypeptidase family protein
VVGPPASDATARFGEFHAACIVRPRMGAEDFSYFCQKWSGAMVGLGCHYPVQGFQFALHSPQFEMDENVLDVEVQLMGYALIQYIEKEISV